jgi:hypothetical protein
LHHYCSDILQENITAMITRTEFDFLPPVEKANTVFEFGEELNVREYGGFKIKLYLVWDFYVELWYYTPRHQISKLASLSADDVIDIYGDNIDISDVFRTEFNN